LTYKALTQHDKQSLLQVFNAVNTFDDGAFDMLLPHWSVVTCKRKQLLTAAGDTERYLYLVTEGIQHGYRRYQDKEFTMVFFYPYSFAGVADSFLLQRPSEINFETLTASRLLRISYTHFMQVIDAYPVMEKWLRVMLSHTLAGVLHRQTELSMYSAADKLEALFKRSSFLFNLVPHKYLASYIGVDPATFSKMYGRMNQ
jgi:CRP-like cAMP-binding protein